MFAVIFEVQPKQEHWNDYLDLAKMLKPKLEKIDGFIDNERFGSKRTHGRVLSLSIWRDEKSVIRWRTQDEHHRVQERGREEIFADYHLRVGEVFFDSDSERTAMSQMRFDITEIGMAKAVTLTEITLRQENSRANDPATFPTHLGLDIDSDDVVDHEVFESIVNPGKFLLLIGWRNETAAVSWNSARPPSVESLRHRRVRIVRDYGMFDRREAPQFYEQAKRA